MINGKTQSGFEYSIDENKLKSKAFQKLIIKLNRAASDTAEDKAATEIIMVEDEYEVFVLGEEQQEKLIDYLNGQSETGYASVQEVQAEVNEIVAAVSEKSKDVKNS